MSTRESFRDELETLLNKHSMENGSDTPDFILAEYLSDCLGTWDKAVQQRERWYDRKVGLALGSLDDDEAVRYIEPPSPMRPERDDSE